MNSETIKDPKKPVNENYLLTIKPEDKNLNFLKNKNLKKLNTDFINEKLTKETDKPIGKKLFDFSDEISLDQVERKLNRFSIAKDSLESSLAYVPYLIEVLIFYII